MYNLPLIDPTWGREKRPPIEAESWIRFLRQYGPIPRNDNMYDESIRRAAQRAKSQPITFEHPYQTRVLSLFAPDATPTSIILTGTAGDGKTHLCRLVWTQLGGNEQEWESENSYIKMWVPSMKTVLHVIRDLSSWVPQREREWEPEKEMILRLFCQSLFDPDSPNSFLIAANDGQLVETWRRLPPTEDILRARTLFESLLVEDRQEEEGVNLHFFNLSRSSSALLVDRALAAFLEHDGWAACYAAQGAENALFGSFCPIRRNYELLRTPLVSGRLRALFELCDYNNLHIPIRQILLLLTNAVLGHPDVKDRLMTAADIPKIVKQGTISQGSLFNNLFGGNLTDSRRGTITVFDYLDRFRIGYETANRVDNILIFGHADNNLRSHFDELLAADSFYGADESYRAAQRQYVEGVESESGRGQLFLQKLIHQRRRLFFTIPETQEAELRLWELTVFKFAGEYLTRVVGALREGRGSERPILARLVKGLNRIFIGMLVASDQALWLATSLSFSSMKISRLFEEQLSVSPRRGEKVEICLENDIPTLRVSLSPTLHSDLPLHLTRYEFLSRVAEGALPNSFSKECYEDILAFKSRLLASLAQRRQQDGEEEVRHAFRLLNLDDTGTPSIEIVELAHGGSV